MLSREKISARCFLSNITRNKVEKLCILSELNQLEKSEK